MKQTAQKPQTETCVKSTLQSYGQVMMAGALVYFASVLLFTAFEIRNVRQDLPVILSQIEKMDPNMDIAGMLKLASTMNEQLPSITDSISGINKNIPAILKESEAIRADAPALLDKADSVASKLNTVTENMASGLITGTAKSVINAPGNIVKGVVGTITGGEKAKTETETAK